MSPAAPPAPTPDASSAGSAHTSSSSRLETFANPPLASCTLFTNTQQCLRKIFVQRVTSSQRYAHNSPNIASCVEVVIEDRVRNATDVHAHSSATELGVVR